MKGLLNQTVQIKRRTGTTYTGDPEYANAVEYPARISYRPRRILGTNGIERPSYARITVAVEAYEDDLVILPDGVTRVPLQVARAYDGAGRFHHTTIDV